MLRNVNKNIYKKAIFKERWFLCICKEKNRDYKGTLEKRRTRWVTHYLRQGNYPYKPGSTN